MATRPVLRCRNALAVAALTAVTATAPGALSPPGTAASAAAPAFDTTPAREALERLLPSRAAQFTLVPVAEPSSGASFSVSGGAGAIQVRGTSPATLLAGVGWYLERVAGIDIGWPGDP
ncbi:alpha-N-acetylglucosaminidase N-terminal domain-containing protein, partial [Streptomyces wedmorensis]